MEEEVRRWAQQGWRRRIFQAAPSAVVCTSERARIAVSHQASVCSDMFCWTFSKTYFWVYSRRARWVGGGGGGIVKPRTLNSFIASMRFSPFNDIRIA